MRKSRETHTSIACLEAQFGMAEGKRRQSLGRPGKKEQDSSTARGKVKGQARVNSQQILYTSAPQTAGAPPIHISIFSL